MANIGFIGLGNMGGPMAANLVKAGHSVKVFDLDEGLVNDLVEAGASRADSAKQAASEVEFVVSMLPSGKIVRSIYIDNDALVDVVDANTLIIDSSTIAAEDSKAVHEAAKAKGIGMIDAPVSGGVGAAKAGTLAFICGGSEADVDRARPILENMGKAAFRAGDSGAGQVAKICNNMLLAVHMIGTAEALEMGAKAGLDPKVLTEIMTASSGRNWSVDTYNPYPGVQDGVPSSNQYQGGFQVKLMNKDLGLAEHAANEVGAKTPMGDLARELYSKHGEAGSSDLDFSSILKLLQ